MMSKTDKKLPVCNDCHSAHTIRRTDIEGFKLDIMTKCGRCHEKIATTYFDTYHGKVSQLGYTKTAKCYDCHGAHDIRSIADPKSHLSHDNVVATCQKCHGPPFTGGRVGPDLGPKAAEVRTEIEFATRMLLHAPKMAKTAARLKVVWPHLTGSEMANVLAYIRTLRPKQ